MVSRVVLAHSSRSSCDLLGDGAFSSEGIEGITAFAERLRPRRSISAKGDQSGSLNMIFLLC